MSDPTLVRKKKNADAQAAFRARRQNYISTLEETVTSLESVVIQLQESCRESRNDSSELRQEISRLRYESREREKYWKAFVQHRKSSSAHPYMQSYDSSSLADHYTPVVPFPNVDGPPPDRTAKYATYPYSIPDSPRDPRWQLTAALPTSLASTGAATPQAHTPSYTESPSLTAPADQAPAYPGRFPTDDRKMALDAGLGSAPYVFPQGSRYQNLAESVPHSRSMSPTTSASSAASLPLTSSYHLSSAEQNQADFDYRGQSLPQVTLHGGIADISLAAAHHPRFARRSDSNAMQQQNDSFSQHEDSTRLRGNRRNLIAHPYRRSQSPGPTPLSSTVAVIKAQAFGALRRTRAKTKRTTDSAARVAQDVLEARGIGPTPMPDVGKP